MRRGVSIYGTFSGDVQSPTTGMDWRWRPPPSHQYLSRVGTGPHRSFLRVSTRTWTEPVYLDLHRFPGMNT